MDKTKICIITNSRKFKGGITAVVSGYFGSKLEQDFEIRYIESCSDSRSKIIKIGKMLCGYLEYLIRLIVFRPQIVHIHSSFGASFYRKIFYIYLARLFKVKILNHIHGAEFDKFYEETTIKKQNLIKKVYNKCDCIIALSDEWKSKLSRIVLEEKIIVIENYSILKRDNAKEEWTNNVLFLGEVGKRKGCCDIPDVVRIVKNKISDCRFIVAGNIIEEDFETIKEKIIRYEIEDNISFPGWVRGDDKDNLLSSADIFFLPSYNEGMPMSILDAMGYALPIVSTTVGGIPKIVVNQVNGYVCEPGDVNEFAEKLVEILLDKAKCKKFGLKSLQIVQESYSLEAHIQKLELVYERLICK